jgi:hypothetical protein
VIVSDDGLLQGPVIRRGFVTFAGGFAVLGGKEKLQRPATVSFTTSRISGVASVSYTNVTYGASVSM